MMKAPNPVYKNHKEALLGLVRIFGPCHLSEILGELRSLVRADAIDEIPYSWKLSRRGYVKDEVVKALEELWLAGQITSSGELGQQRYKAA